MGAYLPPPYRLPSTFEAERPSTEHFAKRVASRASPTHQRWQFVLSLIHSLKDVL